MRKGGQNRTHGTISQNVRLDSYGLADLDHILCCGDQFFDFGFAYEGEKTIAEVYHDSGFTQEIEVSEVKNGVTVQRYWLCPKCGERTRYLYPSKKRFECRKCCGLNYPSSQKTHDCLDFFEKGVKYMQDHLSYEFKGAPIDFIHFTPPRPAGMHKKTYEKHLRAVQRYECKYERAYWKEAKDLLANAGALAGDASIFDPVDLDSLDIDLDLDNISLDLSLGSLDDLNFDFDE